LIRQKVPWQVLGAIMVLSGLCGCDIGAPTPTPVPATATPSPPTPTPRATFPPTPTLTPTPRPSTTPSPEAHPDWALTAEERQRLHESAITFIAETEKEAISVTENLRYLLEDGHPSLVCGPLAVAILRDAGLIDKHVILHDFWLLNPSEPWDVQALESIFPHSRYLWYETTTSIGQLDFAEFPLQPGDFLYLYAGLRGTFEHVLVVTRVDEEGRAFSVTNFKTEQGFVIKEVLLYDPNQPGLGMFYQWTDPANAHLGLTGFGGFHLWRPTEILRTENSTPSAQFSSDVDRILESRGGHWNVLIKRVDGPIIYYRRAEELLYPGSAIQVPIAMLFFHALDQQGVDDYDAYIHANGAQDRTFHQLLQAMVVSSEGEATQVITRWTRERLNSNETLQTWDMHHTTLTPYQSTAWDIAVALEGLYDGRLVSSSARGLILVLMIEHASADDAGIGVLREHLKDGHVFSKQAADMAIGDIAIVEVGQESYILVIFGSSPKYGEKETTIQDLKQAIEEVALAFLNDYLRH
jgi:hypothetical protein